ncbi:MAG: WD40 repeat domain-containing protein, partial [Pirellulales bacterium]
LTVGLATGFAVVSASKQETDRALADRTAALTERTAALDQRTEALDHERRASYFKTVALAHRDVLDHDANHAIELLEGCEPERRRWEWHYLMRICRGGFQRYPTGGSHVLDFAFSPDGKYVAALSESKIQNRLLLRVWDAATWREVTTRTLDDIYSGPLPRSLAARSGQRAHTTRLAFSRDCARLAVSGAGPPGQEPLGSVRCFDTHDWRELPAPQATFPRQTVLTVFPTAQGLAAVTVPDAPDVGNGGYLTAEVYDLDTGKRITSMFCSPPIVDAVASQDGAWVAICGSQVDIADISRDDHRIRPKLEEGNAPTCIAFSPAADRLAVGDSWGNVALYDTFGGVQRSLVRAHSGGTSAIAFSRKGDLLVSVGMGRMLRLADAQTLQERRRMLGLRTFARSVAFSANDSQVVVDEGPHALLNVMDVPSLESAASNNPLWKGSDEFCFAATPDGKWLALGPTFESSVSIWDVERPAWKYTVWNCYPPGVVPTCLAISPDGRRIATSCWDKRMSPGPNVPKLWNCATGKLELSFPATDENISALSFDTEGSRLACGSRDKTVRLWSLPLPPDPQAGAPGRGEGTSSQEGSSTQDDSVGNGLRAVPSADGLPSPSRKGSRVQGSGEGIRNRAQGTEGKKDIIGQGDQGKSEGKAEGKRQKAESQIPKTQDLRPKTFVANPKLPYELWHLSTTHEIACLAIRPNSEELAVAQSPPALEENGARVYIVDLRDGNTLRQVPLHWPAVEIVRYSADGRRLLIGATHDAATLASEVILCDAVSARVLGRFRGTSCGVTGAALSADGERLFGMFRDGNLVLWDVASGEVALVLRGARNQIHGLALSPRGLLVSAGHENLFNFWDGRPIESE